MKTTRTAPRPLTVEFFATGGYDRTSAMIADLGVKVLRINHDGRRTTCTARATSEELSSIAIHECGRRLKVTRLIRKGKVIYGSAS